MSESWEETLVERAVTYTLEHEGRLYVIENVPARVNEATGEQYFAPETVDRVREIIRGSGSPTRVIEAPVYDFDLGAAA